MNLSISKIVWKSRVLDNGDVTLTGYEAMEPEILEKTLLPW